MKEITKVVVDAMGGDNAPHEIIKGAVEAVGKSDAIHVILVGKEDVINYFRCMNNRNLFFIICVPGKFLIDDIFFS